MQPQKSGGKFMVYRTERNEMHVQTTKLLSILIIEMPQYNKSQAIVYLKQKFSCQAT